MKETLRLGVILLIITVVSAGVLAASNNATKDKIAELKLAGSAAALEEVFGDGYEFESLDEAETTALAGEEEIVTEIIEAKKSDSVEGYAIKTSTSGYGGDVIVLTAVTEGEIVGVRVLEHEETKGIGSKATEPEYVELFEGQSTDQAATEAVTGATVTSTAVLQGINEALDLYNTELAN